MSYFSIKIGHLVEKEIQQKIKLLSIENLKERGDVHYDSFEKFDGNFIKVHK